MQQPAKHAGSTERKSGYHLGGTHLEDGSYGQQESVEVGVLAALLSAAVHMQANDGKDNEEQQDEAGDGQEGGCRGQQHLGDLTQALHHSTAEQHDQHVPDLGSAQQQQQPGCRKLSRLVASHICAYAKVCIQLLAENSMSMISLCKGIH